MSAKLIKNTKLAKLPRAGKSVNSTLRNACIRAEQEGWTRVIVIGEGKDICRSMYSKMDHYVAIGLLDIEKASCIKYILEN